MKGEIPLILLAHEIPGAGLSPEAERIWQEMQREQAAASTRGRYRVAPGSTHTVPYDRSDLLIAAIEEVLAEARAR